MVFWALWSSSKCSVVCHSNGLNRGRTEQGTKYSRVLVIAEEDWRIEIILLMPRYWPRFLNKTRVIGSEAISDN